MNSRSYWLCIFNQKTWQEFLDAGADTAGFPASRERVASRIQIGDYLLCYITKASVWVGILEVTSTVFRSDDVIWQSDLFPCRVKVKVIANLPLNKAIPVISQRRSLSVFHGLKDSKVWSGSFRISPSQWRRGDGEIVSESILAAANSEN